MSAKRNLEYRKELFADIVKELPPLFVLHWQEIALDRDVIELAPDWKRYLAMEQAGQLHIITVRDNRVLVGYFFIVLLPHLHYCTTPMAFSDILFLLPGYRKGLAGLRLVAETEKMARALGAKRFYIMCKVYHDLDRLLARLGFKWVEKVFTKLL